MAIPISQLFEAVGSERNIDMLRRECYVASEKYKECIMNCKTLENGSLEISEKCKALLDAWQSSQRLLDAIESELMRSARQGLKSAKDRVSGGKKTAEKDSRHQAMLKVIAEYHAKWDSGYRFPRGTLNEFYKKMAVEFGLELTSIKNAIEKERRKFEHIKLK